MTKINRAHNFLIKFSKRKSSRLLRGALIDWVHTYTKVIQQEKYEKLQTYLTNIRLKQKVFYALHQYKIEERAQNQVDSFNEWKARCQKIRKERLIKRSTYIINLIHTEKQNHMLRTTYNAFKHHYYSQKYERTNEKLTKELAHKERCDSKIAQLKELNSTKIKHQLFRKAFSRYYDIIYIAIKRWKNYIVFKDLMFKRIELQLDRLHKQNLNDAMQTWKSATSTAKLDELQKSNTEISLENESIAKEIKNLTERHKILSQNAENYKYFKLQRCLNKTVRRTKCKGFTIWYRYALDLRSKQSGFQKLAKLLRKHSLQLNINNWKIKTKEQRRLQYISNFLENNERYKSIAKCQKVFDAWYRFKCTQKHIRGNLRRSMIHIDRNIEYKALKQWKAYVHNERVNYIQSKICVLDQEHQTNLQRIEELNTKI